MKIKIIKILNEEKYLLLILLFLGTNIILSINLAEAIMSYFINYVNMSFLDSFYILKFLYFVGWIFFILGTFLTAIRIFLNIKD